MEWFNSTTLLAELVLLTIATVGIAWRFIQHCAERKGHPLPPGPIPLPLVGSAFFVNSQAPWLTFTEWRAKYGDIIYVRMLDTDVIVLNSPSVAAELLELRSRIYSDRPFVPTVDLYGHDFNFGFYHYGDQWRLCRRIFQQTFRANAAPTFYPMQLRRARQLTWNMIDDPDRYPFHFQTFAASVSMSAVYDYEPRPQSDPMVSIIDNFVRVALPGIAPGKVLLLKIFPFLLYVPDWLPGSWISREAKEACAWGIKVVDVPYQYVQKRMRESREYSSTAMVSDHITRMEKLSGSYRSEYETALKYASATAFFASAETTTALLTSFTLAMVENPQIWKRAQVEIDAVVGTDRLPEFGDRPSLPYVDAIMRETMRWKPVLPLLPRAVTCSDIYEGYYIPTGATVYVNIWAISRDETRYPNAEKFIPERFLDEKGRLTDDDPRKFVFGFGRRICPGRHSADASLWSVMVTMLSTLDFHLAQDAEGNDITSKATFATGLTVHPNPFPCRITPRAHINRETVQHALMK